MVTVGTSRSSHLVGLVSMSHRAVFEPQKALGKHFVFRPIKSRANLDG